jgi:hypothetical protein
MRERMLPLFLGTSIPLGLTAVDTSAVSPKGMDVPSIISILNTEDDSVAICPSVLIKTLRS